MFSNATARHLSFLLVVWLASLPSAWAFEAFDDAQFKAAQQSGKAILVAVHADWCPTCRAQAPLIETLAQAPENAGLKVFRVDYDGQKEAVRQLRAVTQSTLIAYHGSQEVGRSIGETRKDAIAALIVKAFGR